MASVETIEVNAYEFLEWAKLKNGDDPFEYADECRCPMANFAKEKYGFLSPDAETSRVNEWSGTDGAPLQIVKSILFVDNRGMTYDLFDCAIDGRSGWPSCIRAIEYDLKQLEDIYAAEDARDGEGEV